MKTKYILTGALSKISLFTILSFLIASCSSQRSYQDHDGIYGSSPDRQQVQQTSSNELYYKDYFGSFTNDTEEAEIFTDVENYRSANDSAQQYATGNAGWGNNTDNITVNVYDNNWGYGMWNNYWYSGWGWNSWGWNPWYGPNYGWGWNSWYGPGWGMGWNNWYGYNYGWSGYGHYYHPNYYSHNSGIRGVRNDMYGRSARTVSDRTYTTGRSVNPNYSNSTRNSTYTGTRSQNATQTRTPVRTMNTTRTRTPNNNTTRTQTQTPTRNNTYTPSTRSSAPSSGTIRSSGNSGRSSGGSVGGSSGRSSGGGGRR